MRERDYIYSRRNVITGAGLVGATVMLGQNAWGEQAQKQSSDKQTQDRQAQTDTSAKEEASLPEVLMQQHAVAGRLLLIYNASATPESASAQPSTKALASTAQMIRSNVDDLHVKLEEEHIFPLFQKSGQMSDLVNTLREQHATARRLTDSILRATEGGGASANTESLKRDIQAYVRMLNAHTAYEETLLYPQIRTAIPASEYDQLKKNISEMTRQKLGPQGFSGLVAKIGELERSAGITGLAQFTARAGRETAMGNPTQQ
jgi:hemerythrin-like domain-containing protein